jgi:DNA adenine methylase
MSDARRPSPLLKWVGGKTQLLEPLLREFPAEFGKYYEPFIGGGAVFFQLGRPDSVISDVNTRLINFYKQVALLPDAVHDEVSKLRAAFLETERSDESTFYSLRERLNSLEPNTPEAAAHFLVVNKTAFNGMYRENKKGAFNVPFNKFRALPSFLDLENLRLASELLSQTEMLASDYKAATSSVVAGDLVYFDPPYVPLSITSNFTSYSAEAFGEAQQLELLQTAKDLKSRGAYVVLSNSHTEWVAEHYGAAGFRVLSVDAKRSIAASSASRASVREAIIVGF